MDMSSSPKPAPKPAPKRAEKSFRKGAQRNWLRGENTPHFRYDLALIRAAKARGRELTLEQMAHARAGIELMSPQKAQVSQ